MKISSSSPMDHYRNNPQEFCIVSAITFRDRIWSDTDIVLVVADDKSIDGQIMTGRELAYLILRILKGVAQPDLMPDTELMVCYSWA